MAYATNYEYILQRILANGIKNYAVYGEDKKTVIDINDTGELTPDMVVANLRETLTNTHGLVYVRLSHKTRGEKGAGAPGQDMMVAIQLGQDSTKAVQGIGNINTAGMYTADQVEKLLIERDQRHQAELMRLQYEAVMNKKLDDLQRQIKEANEGNPMLEKFAPAINGIITKYLAPPQTMAVAGVHIPGTTAEVVEENPQLAQMEAAIDRLLLVDADFPNVLTRLADLAEREPATYNMAKTFLK